MVFRRQRRQRIGGDGVRHRPNEQSRQHRRSILAQHARRAYQIGDVGIILALIRRLDARTSSVLQHNAIADFADAFAAQQQHGFTRCQRMLELLSKCLQRRLELGASLFVHLLQVRRRQIFDLLRSLFPADATIEKTGLDAGFGHLQRLRETRLFGDLFHPLERSIGNRLIQQAIAQFDEMTRFDALLPCCVVDAFVG